MSEKISVIVPIYKVERYLNRCIKSIVNQTYSNLEIILVDDGSPDRCGFICDKWMATDKRIKVIHKKNGGLSSARNKGIELSTGKYIMFIDSDDYIKNNMVEVLYNNLIETDADISICDFIRCRKNKRHYNNYTNKRFVIDDNKKYKMLERNEYNVVSVVQWNKLFKKEIFKNIKYPVGKIHEDEAVIAQEFYNAKRISYILKPLYYYRMRDDSIMHQVSVKRFDAVYGFDKRIDFYSKKNLNEHILPTKCLEIDFLMRYLYKLKKNNLYKGDKIVIENKKKANRLARELLFKKVSFDNKKKYFKFIFFKQLFFRQYESIYK